MARITKPPLERKKEILETSKRVFTEKGFKDAQITEIAQSLGVSQGLIYHYFASKTEILYAVIDELAVMKQEHIDKVMEQTDLLARQKLNLLLDYKLALGGLDLTKMGITSDVAVQEYCAKKITASAIPMVLNLVRLGNGDGSWNCPYPEETALFLANGFRGFYDHLGDFKYRERVKQALVSIISKVLEAPEIGVHSGGKQ